jgi:prepilin-type N-terminal cleavage/methylation domain-containing protein
MKYKIQKIELGFTVIEFLTTLVVIGISFGLQIPTI